MSEKFVRGMLLFAALAWAIPLFTMGIGCLGIVRKCDGWYGVGAVLACLFTMPLWISAITVNFTSMAIKILRVACLLALLAIMYVCGSFVHSFNILSFPFVANYYKTSDVAMNVIFFVHPFLVGIPSVLALLSMIYKDFHLDRRVLPISVTLGKIIRNLAYAAPFSSLLYFLNIALPELYVRFFRPDQGSFLNGVYAPMYVRPLGFIDRGNFGNYVVVIIYFFGTFLITWLFSFMLECWKKKRGSFHRDLPKNTN